VLEADYVVYAGLKVISGMLPPAVQLALLSRIFHRDLSDPRYKTNVHLHYKMKYPCSDAKNQLNGYYDETVSKLVLQEENHSSSNSSSGSFFQVDPALILSPQDETVHKPMTIQSFLDKRLRWITLGPQYNWTLKEYPAEPPPPFPEDIATLLRVAFPETVAEAGIVNIYSPGDALSVHRDVSEECDEGLISVSIGCSALFLISHDNEEGCEVFKLRSGDVIYMTGKSRFAWHAVPKVVAGTCPSWLRNWPSDPVQGRSDFDQWSGWMERKRINFNVRQVKGGHFSR
jgi:DNA alkylation damage repair protein AlkB